MKDQIDFHFSKGKQWFMLVFIFSIQIPLGLMLISSIQGILGNDGKFRPLFPLGVWAFFYGSVLMYRCARRLMCDGPGLSVDQRGVTIYPHARGSPIPWAEITSFKLVHNSPINLFPAAFLRMTIYSRNHKKLVIEPWYFVSSRWNDLLSFIHHHAPESATKDLPEQIPWH